MYQIKMTVTSAEKYLQIKQFIDKNYNEIIWDQKLANDCLEEDFWEHYFVSMPFIFDNLSDLNLFKLVFSEDIDEEI